MTRAAAIAGLAFVLSGCDAAGDPPADPVSMIDCALDDAIEFTGNCSVETSQSDNGLEITVRHSDGGIRRFAVRADRTGFDTADGVFEATNRVAGDKLEVQVEGDRYRFPAALDEIGAQ